jgi:predicted RNA-binding protein with PIN domain
MAELYIIDGYNLLHRLNEITPKCACREHLLDFLVRVKPQGNNTAIIVFDGYGEEDYPRGKIQIVYSKSHSADEYILNLLKQKKYENARVVSEDKELISKAKILGAGVITSSEFLKMGFKKGKSGKRKTQEDYDKPSLLSHQALEIRKELEKVWLQKKKK